MVPIPTILDPGPPPITLTDNSLALFTLTVPKTGLATGTSAVFRNGLFYPGTILGSADPNTAKLTGIVNASFQITPRTGTITIIYDYFANGQFVNTKITAPGGSNNTIRIRGTAKLTYTNDAPDPATGTFPDPKGDSGGPIQYKIHGFKQSEVSG